MTATEFTGNVTQQFVQLDWQLDYVAVRADKPWLLTQPIEAGHKFLNLVGVECTRLDDGRCHSHISLFGQ